MNDVNEFNYVLSESQHYTLYMVSRSLFFVSCLAANCKDDDSGDKEDLAAFLMLMSSNMESVLDDTIHPSDLHSLKDAEPVGGKQ